MIMEMPTPEYGADGTLVSAAQLVPAVVALAAARILVAPFPTRPGDSDFLRIAVAAGLPFVVTPEAAESLPFDNVPRGAVARDLSDLAGKALALPYW